MRFNVVPITTMWLAPGSYCYGLDRLPQTGGAVFALNHLSAIDPPLVGSFSNRAIWYMTKSELLEIPVVGEALTWAGWVPDPPWRERPGRATQGAGACPRGTRRRRLRRGDTATVRLPGRGAPRRAHDRDEGGRPRDPVRARIVRLDAHEPTSVLCRRGEPIRFDGIACNGQGYKQAAEILRLELLRLWRQAAGAVMTGFPPELHGTLRYTHPRARQFHRTHTPRRVSGLA
jgi:Acyltransferase